MTAYIIKKCEIPLSPSSQKRFIHISGAFLDSFSLSMSVCAEKSGLSIAPTFVPFGPHGQKLLHF
jgi:hypothetical protein